MIDVVCCYYRQADLASTFFAGLRRNWKEIRSLVLINDEPWDKEEALDLLQDCPVRITLASHKHQGYGVALSFNQGVELAETDYVFLTSFDQYLPENTLKRILELAAPKRLIVGAVHDVREMPEDPSTLTAPERDISRVGNVLPYGRDIQPLIKKGQHWKFVSNAHTLIDREAHLDIGGFDEGFVGEYGYEDTEWGVRWQAAYGKKSILWSPTESFQLHSKRDRTGSRRNLSILMKSVESKGKRCMS